MLRKHLFLFLIVILVTLSVLALMGLSFPGQQTWSYAAGSFQPVSTTRKSTVAPRVELADLDESGQAEQLVLQKGKAEILTAGELRWNSLDGWQVSDARVTDLDRDGHPEVALLVWRAFQPWPIDRVLPHGGRIKAFQDANGMSCHIILIGWKRGAFRELWAGSALAEPLRAFAAADLDGDHRQELIVLESDYYDAPQAPARALSVWEWNGFGFTLLARANGMFRGMQIIETQDHQSVIQTQK